MPKLWKVYRGPYRKGSADVGSRSTTIAGRVDDRLYLPLVGFDDVTTRRRRRGKKTYTFSAHLLSRAKFLSDIHPGRYTRDGRRGAHTICTNNAPIIIVYDSSRSLYRVQTSRGVSLRTYVLSLF